MSRFLSKIILIGLLSTTALANPIAPITWGSSIIAQFLPPIIKAILGNGYALVPDQAFFGDCSDGDATISSGVTALTRDMYYNNLTISGTGAISFQNQRVFVCGTLDISNAPVFALDGSGTSGNNGGNGGAAGGGGSNVGVGTNIQGRAGGGGGAGGSAGAGAQGSTGTGGNAITGGTGGSGGAGGNGSSTNGGNQRNPVGVTNYPMRDITTWFTPQTGGGGQVFTGGSGSGGGGGGGDLINSGGGGGGGGASGQTVYLCANIIKTSSSTGAATITAWGGQGGAGGSPTAGNTGGGGGGGGGNGGWIVIKYNARSGPVISQLVTSFGGVFGSVGGTGHGTGANGSNGNATPPNNGLIQILDLSTGQITSTTSGSANL